MAVPPLRRHGWKPDQNLRQIEAQIGQIDLALRNRTLPQQARETLEQNRENLRRQLLHPNQ